MKKVTLLPILIFNLLMILPVGSTLLFTWVLGKLTHDVFFGDFILCVCSALFFLTGVVIVYRLFLKIFPFPEGDLPQGHPCELRYLVYLMFWLMIFLPLLRMSFIPVPLSRLVIIALGGKIGEGSYSSGLIFEPHFVTIGQHTQLGADCLIVPHYQAGGRHVSHHPIRIGNNVTIGGRTVIMSGTTIEDGAVIGLCSLVTRGTHIGPNEVWAGVPAKYIKTLEPKKA